MKVWHWLRSFPDRYPWFWRNAPHAVIAGIVLAFVILAAVPQTACLGDCSPRDKWCAGDCSEQCYGNIKVTKITGCYFATTGACGEDTKEEVVDCPNSDDCLTDPWPYPVGECKEHYDKSGRLISCSLENATKDTACCGSGGSGGGDCTPNYTPPVIHTDAVALTPPYPLVDGQDPDRLGFAVTVTAEGGKDKNHCGGGQAKITDFSVSAIELSEKSRDWILHDLALAYPGAHIKGDYPDLPDEQNVSGDNTPLATLWFHYTPLDPGYYEVTVTAKQDKGNKTSTAVIKVPVYMLEVSIVH